MNTATPARSGGQILVDALVAQGTDTVFCVPGESFLTVLDGLYERRDRIRLVVCRQEGGATHMAEAQAKLTGRPGVAMVTRGPGATNASIAVHTARQDSTPLVLFIGHVARGDVGREAWQEVDFVRFFGDMAKWVAVADSAARLPELVHRAFHVAMAGRPGPVVIALPEDMQADTAVVADPPRAEPPEAAPTPEALAALAAELQRAQRPLLLAGGGGWNAQACADLAAFAAAWDLPVAGSFRRQDLHDNRLPHHAGEAGLGMNPALAARIGQADLLLAFGPRLGETSTQGYTLIDIPRPKQRLVHVHADPEELGHVYHADLAINATPAAFLRALRTLAPPPGPRPWAAWRAAARADYEAHQQPLPMPGEVNLAEVVLHLREQLPADTIVTNGAGNYTLWVQRYWRYGGFRTQLAPTSGTMGYGLPAAIGAALREPQRTVLCFAGDGCFLMNGQELATAVHEGAKLLVVVVNNGIYGSIRMHQERHYPGRVWGTDLGNPDFAALARSYGAFGETVLRTADFPAALQRARAAAGPALIELRTDPEALTPRLTVSALRAAAR